MKGWLKGSLFGVVAALLHLAILAYFVRLMVATPGPEWTAHWMIFLALDFPVSLGVLPVTWLAPAAPAGPFHDATNFWWPLAYHGIVGTLWWYIVGWAIERKLRHRASPDASGNAPR